MKKIMMLAMLGLTCMQWRELKTGRLYEIKAVFFFNGVEDSSYYGEPLMLVGKDYPSLIFQRKTDKDEDNLADPIKLNFKKYRTVCIQQWQNEP